MASKKQRRVSIYLAVLGEAAASDSTSLSAMAVSLLSASFSSSSVAWSLFAASGLPQSRGKRARRAITRDFIVLDSLRRANAVQHPARLYRHWL